MLPCISQAAGCLKSWDAQAVWKIWPIFLNLQYFLFEYENSLIQFSIRLSSFPKKVKKSSQIFLSGDVRKPHHFLFVGQHKKKNLTQWGRVLNQSFIIYYPLLSKSQRVHKAGRMQCDVVRSSDVVQEQWFGFPNEEIACGDAFEGYYEITYRPLCRFDEPVRIFTPDTY